MKLHRLYLAAAFAALFTAHPAAARLGESEAQSKARYGEEKPDLIGANDKPLLVGAKEAAYFYQG